MAEIPLPDVWDHVEDEALRRRLSVIDRLAYRCVPGWEKYRDGKLRDSDTQPWRSDYGLRTALAELPERIQSRMRRPFLEHVQALAVEEHQAIQEEAERDKSGGDPDVCFRCGDFGLLEDSSLEDRYVDRYETHVKTLRRRYVYCDCRAGRAKYERWTGREAPPRNSRPRSTGGKLEKAVEHPDDLLFPGGNDGD